MRKEGNMKIDDLDFQFEVKSVDDETGMFKGRASVFGVLDSFMDKVKRGAFKETIKEKGAEGIRMLWHHQRNLPIGVWTSIKETTRALEVEGTLATGIQLGKEAHELLKMGAIDGLSIGFRTRKSQIDEVSGVRTLLDIDLKEISLVTFPALEPARITSVKEVAPFQDLPISARSDPWSPSGALKRVMEHEDRDKAFLWDDGDEQRFLICDVVDGELHIIPRAVFAAAAQTQGACRAAVMDEPDLTGVRERLDEYYMKLRAEFNDETLIAPWRAANTFTKTLSSVASLVETERDFETFLRDAGWSRKEAEAIVAKGFRTASRQGEPADGLQALVDGARSATEVIQPSGGTKDAP